MLSVAFRGAVGWAHVRIAFIDRPSLLSAYIVSGPRGFHKFTGNLRSLRVQSWFAETEMSGNFYKGTSKDQTPFFKDKDSQLIAQRKVSTDQRFAGGMFISVCFSVARNREMVNCSIFFMWLVEQSTNR